MLQKSCGDHGAEIADLADINRGTFYLHYKDIYDLYDQIKQRDAGGIFRHHQQSIRKKSTRGSCCPCCSTPLPFWPKMRTSAIVILQNYDTVFLSRLLKGRRR
jgi:AcrR family transcriptional regulator